MEHVQADAVVLHEFLLGAFADPGKLDDVARFVTSPLEEPPKLRVADHGQRLPNLSPLFGRGVGFYFTTRESGGG